MERDLLLRFLRRHPPRCAGPDQRLCRRDGDRGRAYRVEVAAHGLEHRLYRCAPVGWPCDRAAGAAHRPAHPLGARHDPDLAHRQSAVRARPQLAAAALLPECDAAFPVSAAAHRLPDQPACLSDLRPEHHPCLGLADLCLCAAASGLFDDLVGEYAGRGSPAVLGRNLRDDPGLSPRAPDGHDLLPAAQGQVQRDGQGQPARPDLFRPVDGAPAPDLHRPHHLRHRSGDREAGLLPASVQHSDRYAGAERRLGRVQSDHPDRRRFGRARDAAGARIYPHRHRIAGHPLHGRWLCDRRDDDRHFDGRCRDRRAARLPAARPARRLYVAADG